jgi:hypothetical protein
MDESAWILLIVVFMLSGSALIYLLFGSPDRHSSKPPAVLANTLADRGWSRYAAEDRAARPVAEPHPTTPAPDSPREDTPALPLSALQAIKPNPATPALQSLSPLSGIVEGVSNPDSEKLITLLKAVLEYQNSLQNAVNSNITLDVFVFGIFFSLLPCGLVYLLVPNGFGILLSVFSGFLLSFLLINHEKSKNIKDMGSKLNSAIADAVNAFPAIILAAGGPSVLRNPEHIEHLICAAKAGKISEGVNSISQHQLAPATPITTATAHFAARPHRASAVLVLGILGLFLPLLGPVAWIMGASDIKAMEAGQMDRTGYDQTKAGRTCGTIGTLLYGSLILICLANSIK